MYKSQFEGAEADRRLALIDSINEQLCPKRSGTLPLTIDSIGGNLSDWTIYGNTEGVGERTKNFVRVIVGATSQGITFTVDPVAGTVTANGTATGTAQLRITINNPDDPNNTNVPSGNYYYSGCPSGGSDSKYNCYSWDNDTGARSKKWDGTTNAEQDNGQGSCQVQINGHRQSIILRIASGYTANNVVFKPMLRRADATPDFEPYGYQIPLDIHNENNNNKHMDIYIGDSKLYEGQSVSRDSTGIEIEVERGQSVIETTLTNKPEIDVKIDRIKMIEQTLISMQSSGGYNETQTDYITDNVEEVTQ